MTLLVIVPVIIGVVSPTGARTPRRGLETSAQSCGQRNQRQRLSQEKARDAAATTSMAKDDDGNSTAGAQCKEETSKEDVPESYVSNQIKIQGNIHFDSKLYHASGKRPTTFDIRRARAGIQGKLNKSISFRLQAELADTPHVRDAWVDFGFREWLHLRVGQTKPPFSTSWWTSGSNVHFLERGAGTPVYPYLDRGWWLWGTTLGDGLTWNIAAFTGAGMERDVEGGDIDDHKDYFGRIFWSPIVGRTESGLNGLHLCVEGSLGKQSVPTKRFEQKGYSAAVREDRYWTWEAGENARIGRRDRVGLEMHCVMGSISFSTERLNAYYEDIEVHVKDGARALKSDGRVASWSTWLSWFPTGEKKSVGNFGWKQPNPKRPFDPGRLGGIGAWEILLRYTLTDTSRPLFEAHENGNEGYRILAGADHVSELTLGLNWTWNPMVRWQLNFVHLRKSGGVIRSGDDDDAAGMERSESDSMVGLRMMFNF
jgi:phosphate-selective porin